MENVLLNDRIQVILSLIAFLLIKTTTKLDKRHIVYADWSSHIWWRSTNNGFSSIFTILNRSLCQNYIGLTAKTQTFFSILEIVVPI